MKKFILLALLTSLSGCKPDWNVPMGYEKTPIGYPLGAGATYCVDEYKYGLCYNWHAKSEWCVSPKGKYVEPPTVLCKDIPQSVKDTLSKP